MKYSQLAHEDKTAYIEGRIRAAEQEHYQCSIELDLAINARDVGRMVELKELLSSIESTLQTLHVK